MPVIRISFSKSQSTPQRTQPLFPSKSPPTHNPPMPTPSKLYSIPQRPPTPFLFWTPSHSQPFHTTNFNSQNFNQLHQHFSPFLFQSPQYPQLPLMAKGKEGKGWGGGGLYTRRGALRGALTTLGARRGATPSHQSPDHPSIDIMHFHITNVLTSNTSIPLYFRT